MSSENNNLPNDKRLFHYGDSPLRSSYNLTFFFSLLHFIFFIANQNNTDYEACKPILIIAIA